MLPDAKEIAAQIVASRPRGAPFPTDAEIRAHLVADPANSKILIEDQHVQQVREALSLRPEYAAAP